MTFAPQNPAPQAFTREMLAVAFNWLQAQPEATRRLATTPEALISMYLRGTRPSANPSAQVAPTFDSDAPVSGQNFMNDLRHLAEGLKQFEEPRSHQQPLGAYAKTPKAETPPPQRQPNLNFTPPVPPAPVSQPALENSGENSANLSATSCQILCQDMIQEVKSKLNLSSDGEALNMMVAIAYKNLKNLLT